LGPHGDGKQEGGLGVGSGTGGIAASFKENEHVILSHISGSCNGEYEDGWLSSELMHCVAW
jgi:hypothetical protein